MPEPGPGRYRGRPDGAVAWRCHDPPGWFVLSGRATAPAQPRLRQSHGTLRKDLA
jgi:hypothetical protein